MRACVRFFKEKCWTNISLDCYSIIDSVRRKKNILTRNFLEFFTVVWFSDCVALPEEETSARKEGKSEQEGAYYTENLLWNLKINSQFYWLNEVFVCPKFSVKVTNKINCKELAWDFNFFRKVPCQYILWCPE